MKINKRLLIATAALGLASAAIAVVKGNDHEEISRPATAASCPGGVKTSGGPATRVDLSVVGGDAEVSRNVQIHVASCGPSTVNARVESVASASGDGADASAPVSQPSSDAQSLHRPPSHEAAEPTNATMQRPARVAG